MASVWINGVLVSKVRLVASDCRGGEPMDIESLETDIWRGGKPVYLYLSFNLPVTYQVEVEPLPLIQGQGESPQW